MFKLIKLIKKIITFLKNQKAYFDKQNFLEKYFYLSIVGLILMFGSVFIYMVYSGRIESAGRRFVEDIARKQETYHRKHGMFFSTGALPVMYSPELGIDARRNMFFKFFKTNGDEESYTVEVMNVHEALGTRLNIITISGQYDGSRYSRFGRRSRRVRDENIH